MYRITSIAILFITLVSVFSLSLQTAYKNYLCQDTKQYLSIADAQITVCGITCDYQYVDSKDSDSIININYSAPPLYFETMELDLPALLLRASGHLQPLHYENHYDFDFIHFQWQPPQS